MPGCVVACPLKRFSLNKIPDEPFTETPAQEMSGPFFLYPQPILAVRSSKMSDNDKCDVHLKMGWKGGAPVIFGKRSSPPVGTGPFRSVRIRAGIPPTSADHAGIGAAWIRMVPVVT